MSTHAQPTFSFELFPPKTDKGVAKLRDTVTTLNARHPEFFSVTYGAGGSTQSNTFAAVDWIPNRASPRRRTCRVSAAPATNCSISSRYADQGIERLVALRGDLPSGAGPVPWAT